MTTWGLVRLPDGTVSGGFATGDGAVGASVAALLDGIVALAAGVPLAVALAALPLHVDTVVEIDAQDTAAADAEAVVSGLVDALGPDHAAVATGRPVADALKRVDGDVVIGSLERDGVIAPGLPCVYRRDVLAGVLGGSDATGGATGIDALGLLLDAGHTVGIIPVDGAPVTLSGRA
jgi:2-C-methyl-D-erythritol 4-phosphate cytidylyltransferase